MILPPFPGAILRKQANENITILDTIQKDTGNNRNKMSSLMYEDVPHNGMTICHSCLLMWFNLGLLI